MAPPFRTAKKWMTKRIIPDYTNQLDLFSEAPQETSAPEANAPARNSGASGTRPRPFQQLDFGPWEPLRPEDDVSSPETKPAPTAFRGDGVQSSPVQTKVGQQEVTSPGVRAGNRRDSHTGDVFDIEPEEKSSRDFRITVAHRIGQGGLREKGNDNIAAIRLLKVLEVENRQATLDELAILARYVGWGGMPNVFGNYPPQEWRSTAGEVRELLDASEFDSARASTPNAHFTSPMVIEAVWSGLQQLGLGKGAQILEPAMGVGSFFGLMPESLHGGHRTGVELAARRRHNFLNCV